MTDERKTIHDKISEAFNVETTDIVETGNNLPITLEDDSTEELDSDFNDARETLKQLELNGIEAINSLMDLARESEKPNAFGVLADLIKTTAGISKDRLTIHETKKTIKNNKPDDIQPNGSMNIKNANIIVGSTKDVLKKIKDE